MTTANKAGQITARLHRYLADRHPSRLITVTSEVAGRVVPVVLKLELDNPWGSIKDRTAISLVASLAGPLARPDAVLVESTSGNLGVALAAISADLGVRFIAVVDSRLPPPMAKRLVDMGAELDQVSGTGGGGSELHSRIRRVRELCSSTPGAVWTNQYSNVENPMAHYRGTGPEMAMQTRGEADAVFIAVSTGGTLAGVGRYLRDFHPRTRIVAVDVAGSTVFQDCPAPRLLTGIGASRKSSFLRPWHYDDVVLVPDTQAIMFCRELRAAAGISLGGSSGAVFAACLRYLAAHPEIRRPVCLCPDSGDSYAETLYSDSWLAEHGIDLDRAALCPVPGGKPAIIHAAGPGWDNLT